MALDDFQECADQRRVSGVLLTCHRVRNHAGPHASGTYGTRWRDSGEVGTPGRTAGRRRYCD